MAMKKSKEEPQAQEQNELPPPTKNKQGKPLPRLTIAYTAAFLISFIPMAAFLYSLNNKYNLSLLERESQDQFIVQKYTAILQNREQTFQHTHRRLRILQGNYNDSQQTIMQLRTELAMLEKKHEHEMEGYKLKLNEALEKIESLKGIEQSCRAE